MTQRVRSTISRTTLIGPWIGAVYLSPFAFMYLVGDYDSWTKLFEDFPWSYAIPGFIFVYAIGGIPAFAVGVMFTLIGSRLNRLPFWSGPFCGAIVSFIFLLYDHLTKLSWRPAIGDSFGSSAFAFSLFIFPAIGCWFAVRRFWNNSSIP